MASKYKICIYLKGKEKPIILTDVVSKENTYQDTVEYFFDAKKEKDKLLTLDFNNDNVILNTSDIDAVVISKPVIDTANLVTVEEDIEILDEADDAQPEKFSVDEVIDTDEISEEDEASVFDSAGDSIGVE